VQRSVPKWRRALTYRMPLAQPMAHYFSWSADKHIAIYEMAIADMSANLFPEERATLTRAVPRRIREFATGRECARQAMAKLGYPPAPIVAGADRAPCWPHGLVGSITHAAEHCAAAVARTGDGYHSLGLDLEPALALSPDLLETICLPAERTWLEAQPRSDREVFARAIFSAKECAYKVQYPLSRQVLEFYDLRLELDMQQGQFVAVFARDCPPFASGDEIVGGIRIERGHVACAAAIFSNVARAPQGSRAL
jgi:4'-phosphopantetheinyl transferase EntD